MKFIFIFLSIIFYNLLKYYFPNTGIGIITVLPVYIFSSSIFSYFLFFKIKNKILYWALGFLLVNFLGLFFCWPYEICSPAKEINNYANITELYESAEFKEFYNYDICQYGHHISRYKFSNFLRNKRIYEVAIWSKKEEAFDSKYIIFINGLNQVYVSNNNTLIFQREEENSLFFVDIFKNDSIGIKLSYSNESFIFKNSTLAGQIRNLTKYNENDLSPFLRDVFLSRLRKKMSPLSVEEAELSMKLRKIKK